MVKTTHALTFGSLGWMMQLFPVVFPNQFPPDGPGGVNTSALWITFMGWVHLGSAALILLRVQVLPWCQQMLAWRPTGMAGTARRVRAWRAAVPRLPASVLRPAARLDASMARLAAAPEMRRQPVRSAAGIDQRAAA